jgi:hypothetical protein
MDEFNPYAAPKAEISRDAPWIDEDIDIWRDGKTLVVKKAKKGVILPARCVKCNAPAAQMLKRNLMWHPPGWYFMIIISLPIYIIVALIVRQTIKLEVGLCETHRGKRRLAITIGWVLSLLGIGLLVAGLIITNDLSPYLVGIGIASLLIGILYGNFGAQTLTAQRIDKHFARLNGAGPAYLTVFPDWR